MKKPLWFYDEIYRQNFYVFYGWHDWEFQSHIKKKYDFDIDARGFHGKCHHLINRSEGRDVILIYVRRDKKSVMQITLAHECIHAANMILQDRGVITDQTNDEAHAYYVSWLMRKVLE